MAGLFSDHGVRDSVNAVAKEKQYEALIRSKAFELERKKVMGDKAIEASKKSGQMQADATKYAGTMNLLGSVVGAATSVIPQTGAYKKWAGNNFGPNQYSNTAAYATDHGISYNQADHILKGGGTTWNTSMSNNAYTPLSATQAFSNNNAIGSDFYRMNFDPSYSPYSNNVDLTSSNSFKTNLSGINSSHSLLDGPHGFSNAFSQSAMNNIYGNTYNDGGLVIHTNKGWY